MNQPVSGPLQLRERLSDWRGILVLAALVAVIIWQGLRGTPDGRLHVYFLDVGQGDAIFVRAPDGRQLLIDGGPAPGVLLSEISDLMPFWDRTLDLVVLTHPDADHLNGLVSVLDRYQVRAVLDTSLSENAPEASLWRERLGASQCRREYARPGMQLSVGGLVISVLHAGSDQEVNPRDGNNNASTVLRLDYGNSRFLLTGDAEEAAEAEMLASGMPLQADVLKVAHHGSNRSTSSVFLAAVQPRMAVIQVGSGNRFEHPHPGVLARLAGTQVLRTDLRGRVEVTSDGRRLWVRTARKSPAADR